MPSDEQVPVSPETPANPTPADPQKPAAPPAPVEGKQADPPSARDEAPATPPDDLPVMGDGDVLDRLSPPKPTQTPVVPPAAPKPGETPTPDPAAAKPPEGEDSDEPQEGDETPPTKEELASMHSKTRRRFKTLMAREEAARPYAEFGQDIAVRAHDAGVEIHTVDAWIEAGLRLRKGDPEALNMVANVLKAKGYQFEAPAPAAPDYGPLNTLLGVLARTGDISEATKSEITKALETAVPKAPVKPVTPPPAPAQPRQAPQVDFVGMARQEMAQTSAEYQAELGANWPAFREKAVAELQKVEAALPPHVRDNPRLFNARWTKVCERLRQAQSAPPKTPTIQSAARPNTGTPPPPQPLKPGTPEYDDALLSGKINVG